MMEETIEIQNAVEVQQIDARKEINDILDTQIAEQNTQMGTISDQLNEISNTVSNIQTGDVDLTEVTDKLDELDTTMITTQNQDILETLANQQNQINTIEEKVDSILAKLDEM